MASIYIYKRSGKCVELSSPHLSETDIAALRAALPPNIEGISLTLPAHLATQAVPEVKTELREGMISEYLKSVGLKLEQLQQLPGAFLCYDLAFRLNPRSDILMIKARALTQHGYADRAQKLLQSYAERYPEDPEPSFIFGKLALGRADYEEARRFFDEAEKKRQTNAADAALNQHLPLYQRAVQLYLDRDQLFQRNLSREQCMAEIKDLRQRTQTLLQDIRSHREQGLQGLEFLLENQDKVFEKWLEEM